MTEMSALAAIDSFPYRHRVHEVMGTPLVTSRIGTVLTEAARQMSHKGVSSVVVIDEQGRPAGILTERDVLKAVAAKGADAADQPVGTVMSAPVATVRRDALVYVAMGRMDRLKLRHLVVVDERGVAVGMVTVRGLLHLRTSTALVVGDEIASATEPTQMASAIAKLPRLARELLAEHADGVAVAAVCSSMFRDATARAAELAEQAMAAEGWGPAPAPWCALLLGSGGRRESLLAPDQDNAIVHAGSTEDDPWFAELGKRMCDMLQGAGVPYCNGGVMAMNAEWRHDTQGWQQQIDRWIADAAGPELLNVHIFIDFRAVHGSTELADRLRAHLTEHAARSHRFLTAMAQAAGKLRAPLGVLGQFITRNGRLDLKASALLPLTSTARVLALKHRIDATGTGARLDALAAGGHLPEQEARSLRESHELMLRILLEQQVADIAAGEAPGNRIDPKRLAPHERQRLKESFKEINALNWILENALSTA